jgi:hypothetical protein
MAERVNEVGLGWNESDSKASVKAGRGKGIVRQKQKVTINA